MQIEFWNESRFCPACDRYVHFLLSPEHAYCVDCGGRVSLLSAPDFRQFRKELSGQTPGNLRVLPGDDDDTEVRRV